MPLLKARVNYCMYTLSSNDGVNKGIDDISEKYIDRMRLTIPKNTVSGCVSVSLGIGWCKFDDFVGNIFWQKIAPMVRDVSKMAWLLVIVPLLESGVAV